MKKSIKHQENKIILTGIILAIAVLAACFIGFFWLDSTIAEASEKRKDREVTLSEEMQNELAYNPSVTPEAAESEHAEAEAKTPEITPKPLKTVFPETQHDMTLTPTPDPQEYWATHPTPTPEASYNAGNTVSVWLSSAGNVDMSSYKKLSVSSSSTTALSKNSSSDYVFDGHTETLWAEAQSGDGTQEILYAKFKKSQKVSCISFKLGNWNSYDAWAQNGRPTEITVWLAGNSYKVTFPDYMEEYCLEFSVPVETSELSFRIESVSSGGTEDTYITDIIMYSEGN